MSAIIRLGSFNYEITIKSYVLKKKTLKINLLIESHLTHVNLISM